MSVSVERSGGRVGGVARPFLTVVSGLPRSGTSLMMRMLAAGGLPVLYDDIRKPDVDNPLGYYEYEPVKALKADASWIATSLGMGVKMVHVLIYDLPPGIEYRVLFMHRKLDEVIASQNAMLGRLGKSPRHDDETTAQMFRGHLSRFSAWLKERPNIRVLDVDYNAMVLDPEPIVAAIDEFLGGGLDRDAMARSVDPDLYRNRVG